MNSELVFSIGQIFDNVSIDGALGRHRATKYLIAPYQRGYKWESGEENGAVSILLRDIIEAFEIGSKEYYLQYITTQVNEHQGNKVLEVIDGQQRLTTLTLLFSVISDLTGDEQFEFVKDKLSYQIRGKVTSFFSKYVYDDISVLSKQSWPEFLSSSPDCNEQDIFYLFHAVERIYEALSTFGEASSIGDLAAFARDKVKIILNNVDGNISCEKVFSNLNNNKVELTNVELIKGLFLTRSAREKLMGRDPAYKEVVELRALLGRQWDEMAAWCFSEDIRALFFKGKNNPIFQLLQLVAKKNGYQMVAGPQKDKFALFNFFQKQIKKGVHPASYFFGDLKTTYGILNNWYKHPQVYNALGYILYAKKGDSSILDLTSQLDRPITAVEGYLKKWAFKFIPDDIDQLNYEDHDKEIHRVLLALNVFLVKERFNFTAYAKDDWSLEHIFPQKPSELPEELQERDVRLIKQILVIPLEHKQRLITRFGKFNLVHYNSIVRKLKKCPCKLSAEEATLLYSFLKPDKLNKLGNMALLTSRDNSSNKNGMFNTKRHNIVRRVSNGSFVPRHTFDVFSKLISPKMTEDTGLWSDNDISVHQEWIKTKITQLRKDLLTGK